MAGVYSVTQINSYIRNLFSRDIALSGITIRGEVSNCKYQSNGTIYFTLKDENAAISCVCFSGSRQALSFLMDNGQQLDVTGQISVYEKTGVYQLYMSKAVISGMGELYERYLKLKAQMEEMGMFDAGYKKPIPAYASRIGIVTAETGAAIRDIINVSTRRNPYVKLYLMPTLVQGQYAAESIANAIKKLDAYNLDVIIVGRGGGSIEDLWAFNEEVVANAIFNCKTPVISAVGHETDFTIADFVADHRAPTPSAAAELACFDYEALQQQFSAYQSQLDRFMRYRLEEAGQKKKTLEARLKAQAPDQRLMRMKDQMKHLRERAGSLLNERLERAKENLSRQSTRLDLDMKHKDETARLRLSGIAGRLDAASPLKKLSGGFGYMETGGKAVRHVSDVKKGDLLESYVSDGKIISIVQEGIQTNGRK